MNMMKKAAVYQSKATSSGTYAYTWDVYAMLYTYTEEEYISGTLIDSDTVVMTAEQITQNGGVLESNYTVEINDNDVISYTYQSKAKAADASGTVSSNSSSAYPSNGESNGYWYVLRT